VKKVEAIIRHMKLGDVREALLASGIVGMTVTEVRGYGRQKGHVDTYRGVEYDVAFHPKSKIEVVVTDKDAELAIDTILKTARTGELGDGKVFVTELENVIRIRSGEVGEAVV
jgi:nitrogen regulatory protein P-II 1